MSVEGWLRAYGSHSMYYCVINEAYLVEKKKTVLWFKVVDAL